MLRTSLQLSLPTTIESFVPLKDDLTILIPSYNAEKTIKRAIESVPACVGNILVCDDASTDNTLQVIKQISDRRINLLSLETNSGVGTVRDILIQQCETPFAIWLDSDDELKAGRVELLAEQLKAGFDIVYDAVDIIDQYGNHSLVKSAPSLLNKGDYINIQFGRNYIPSIGFPAVNVASSKEIGYKPVRAIEDCDHLLRSLINRRRIKILESNLYRQYQSESSLSRDEQLMKKSNQLLLSELNEAEVQSYIYSLKIPDDLIIEILMYFYVNSENWTALKKLCKDNSRASSRMRYLNNYMQGVLAMQNREVVTAKAFFENAKQIFETAEVLNNIAALSMDTYQRKILLERALTFRSNYNDAKENVIPGKCKITMLPLRGTQLNYADTPYSE